MKNNKMRLNSDIVNDDIEIFKEFSEETGLNADTFNDSLFSTITSFISTGCYSLNKILSGSLFKGIAHGRITAFVGLPGVGKSYICKNIIREAQKDGYGVVLYDTEGAYDKEDLQRFNINPEKIMYPQVTTINEWKTHIVKFLEFAYQKNPERKWLIVTDSIANLLTEKEVEDTNEGNTSQDMGLRAKQFSAASRIIQRTISKCNATMVITNHTYEKPAPNPNMQPTEIPKGGNAFIYMASYIIGIKKYALKEDVKNPVDNSTEKKKIGNRLIFQTLKNRFVPEGLTSEAYLNFNIGLLPYHGLLEDAIKHGFIERSGNRWLVKHLNKTVWLKELYTKEVWDPILEELDKKISEDIRYPDYKEDIQQLFDINGSSDIIE